MAASREATQLSSKVRATTNEVVRPIILARREMRRRSEQWLGIEGAKRVVVMIGYLILIFVIALIGRVNAADLTVRAKNG